MNTESYRLWRCLTASKQMLIALLCITGLVAPAVVLSSPASASTPNCASADSDPDGDGWGWENNQSCRVVNTPTVDEPASPPPTGTPDCTDRNSDPDGDGWGWENNQTCQMPVSLIAQPLGALPPAYSELCWRAESFAAGCYVSGGAWTQEFREYNDQFDVVPSGETVGARVQVISDVSDMTSNGNVLYVVGPYLMAVANPNGPFQNVIAESNRVLGLNTGWAGARLRDRAVDEGATVVYIGFGHEGSTDIPTSMRVTAIKQAIRAFENARPNFGNEDADSALVGFSLGGVASRIALAELENERFDHGVDTFISWDSPHNGAYIPAALQQIPIFMRNASQKMNGSFWLNIFDEVNHDTIDENIAEAEAVIAQTLKNPVARELLITNLAYPDRARPAQTLGTEYPQQTHNIAVASGSLDLQTPRTLDSQVLTVRTGRAGDDSRKAEVTMDIVMPEFAPYMGTTFDAQFSWKGTFRGLKYGERRYYSETDTVTVSSTYARAYDHGPCGFDPSIVDGLATQFRTVLSKTWSNAEVTTGERDQCFVPTASAIDHDVRWENGRLVSASRFDELIGDNVNNEHMHVTLGTSLRAADAVADTFN